MYIKQLSVFLENKAGTLAEVTTLLADHGIDLKSLSIAETSDFGILRLIVDDTDKAQKVLNEANYICKITQAIGIIIEDKPGTTAAVLRILADAGINVEYAYAFISHDTDKAYLICKVGDNEEATQILTNAGVKLACKADIF